MSKSRKYLILVADGMADLPLAELDGKTPLEIARTPNMDRMASGGKIGLANFIPSGMIPGSDVANMGIFGYDPRKYYAGRGPLEAENLGVVLNDDEVAFRCNFVTEEKDILVDYSAGHISTREAQVLIEYLNTHLGTDDIRFYSGISYRHLMVVRGRSEELLKLRCYPPHDIMDKKITDYLPGNKKDGFLWDLMNRSRELLITHEVNQVRIDLHENPANLIWLWGQGKKIALPAFREKYHITGSVISAVDLIKGIGKAIGLEALAVPGITGYYDTNYEGKATYALNSLKDNDFVFVHVEAPDEAGHNGDMRAKIAAIENIDRYILEPVLEYMNHSGPMRVMVLPDHPTPIALRTHTADPVCFLMFGEGIQPMNPPAKSYNEWSAAESGYSFQQGTQLIDTFFSEDTI